MTAEPYSNSERRARGAYYTPVDATDLIAEWAIREPGDSVLEPSFGDGAFLRSVARRFAILGEPEPEVYGVEMEQGAHRSAVEAGLISRDRAQASDFTTVAAHPVTVAIGNPPFVRIRNLDKDGRAAALGAAAEALGHQMDPSGSLWMPIVLHAATFVRLGGRMAWVLPYEATHVRYAKPFWSFLARSFGSVEVVRVRERVFPSILQDVVLLFVDQRGATSTSVTFRWYGTRSEFVSGVAEGQATLEVADILGDRRPFERALSTAPTTGIEVNRVADVLDVRIGYVSGDKQFFHPSPDVAARFGLSESSLRPTIASSRAAAGSGIWTSALGTISSVFVPSERLDDADSAYIAFGESQGVDSRFKCRTRTPWYRVPIASPADLVFTVFGESPRPMINDIGALASNSLIVGRLTGPMSSEQIVASWFTSLARLSMLQNVHALGGGMMVLIPGELNRIELPIVSTTSHLAELDELVAAGRIDEAYELGDRVVLIGEFGLSVEQVRVLREKVEVAERWRRRVL